MFLYFKDKQDSNSEMIYAREVVPATAPSFWLFKYVPYLTAPINCLFICALLYDAQLPLSSQVPQKIGAYLLLDLSSLGGNVADGIFLGCVFFLLLVYVMSVLCSRDCFHKRSLFVARVFLTDVFFIPFLKRFLERLNCTVSLQRTLQPSVLVEDPTEECWQGVHWAYATLALGATLLTLWGSLEFASSRQFIHSRFLHKGQSLIINQSLQFILVALSLFSEGGASLLVFILTSLFHFLCILLLILVIYFIIAICYQFNYFVILA
jgi:hypothetical protein